MIVKVVDTAFIRLARIMHSAGCRVVNSHHDPRTMRYGVFKLSKEVDLTPVYWECEVLESYRFRYKDILYLPSNTSASEVVQVQLENPDKRVRVEGSYANELIN